MGDPVFNLVLTGPPSIAKTSCVQLYQHIFGDGDMVQTKGSTLKGLLPSFKEPVRNGELIDARFFIGVDELFRSPAADAHKQGWKNVNEQTRAYLSSLLPVLTRRRQRTSAGTGSVTEPMRAALMATDNMTAETVGALRATVMDDPAVLRRFLLVQLGNEDEWKRLENAPVKPSEQELIPMCQDHWMKKYTFSVKKLRRLAEWARLKSRDIIVDTTKGIEYINTEVMDALMQAFSEGESLPEQGLIEKATRKIVMRLHMDGAVRCAAIMRTVFEKEDEGVPEEIIVKEEDYVQAVAVLRRPIRSMAFMFDEAIKENIREQEPQGVLRV